MVDPDGQRVTVKSVELTTGSLPSFIFPSSTGLKINPVQMKHVGSYTIKVTITDGLVSPSFLFNLFVTN